MTAMIREKEIIAMDLRGNKIEFNLEDMYHTLK